VNGLAQLNRLDFPSTISLSIGTYSVQGFHASGSGSHTVTTTSGSQQRRWRFDERAGLVGSSTPTSSSDNAPMATQAPPVEADGNPPRLPRNVVDQLPSTGSVTRIHRSLHANANDAVLDDVFALD
jgi:hypothetical protein